ncbi:molybdenum cofactor biosynthesis protein MoaE [Lysinibacter sp. HNR]|uniref:molybdenum cofactor biosynthesis protein MoaE n=1 Tax=Lysinibacter sp. HNR TaxID=3031408 RepID=UPI0024354A7C|nr:molybdenum cofactor biosynthesis protein MoaE [Lysinibacter sp. HNR]WGD36572.1 molybdenum cofactor biosynthesis protein MoaE [Lysinibacter sp. HNR]
MTILRISDTPLDLASHLEAVDSPHSGAVVTFIGRVRDHDPAVTGPVTLLEYSAHPSAVEVLRGLVERIVPNGILVAVSHRVGRLEVGDLAVIVCVSSAHRAEAYEVSRKLIEAIKAELPVWKKQHRADGTHDWVGLS